MSRIKSVSLLYVCASASTELGRYINVIIIIIVIVIMLKVKRWMVAINMYTTSRYFNNYSG